MSNSWRPSHDEKAYVIERVDGEIPRELNGSLYRNGPSQHILPEGGYEALHLFDGDGMVHAFRFEDGRVAYRGRFVRNESFLVEAEEGRFCMNSVGVQVDNPTERVSIRQQHNTNVVHHGGKLMALVENAWPFEIDGLSLDPRGETDFGCERLGMSVSAHPHIDGRTGQMVIHGYQLLAPYYQVYVVEPDGRASLAEPVAAPYPVMMHDIAITENHIILLLCPTVIDGERLMAGGSFGECVSWQPDKGLRFGIRRREAGSAVRWFDAPTPAFIFHTGNAYEEEGKVYMDACSYLDGAGLLDTLSVARGGQPGGGAGAYPYLYEFDLEGGACRETRLGDRSAEFPRLDERLAGYKNRYGFALVEGPTGSPLAGGSLCRYDRQGGTAAYYDLGQGQFPGEPVFVPRSADSPEGDGFLLSVVYDAPQDGSYVAVFDATDLAAGPMARAHLEHRIPMGFHGNFVSGVV
jgi:carotenoid cleavage dioxygenase